MSGVISIDVESVKRASNCNVHFVPCEIDYNGQAKIQEYFSSSISQTTEPGLTATFRGRPLDGEIKEIPSGYTGIVLKESQKTYTDDEDKKLTATGKFSKFHFWNLDKKPAKDDRLHQVLEWMEIAKVLHSPVTKESGNGIKMEQN